MTWTISHGKPNPGGPFDGFHSRSYSQVGEWVEALKALPLPGRDIAILEPLTRDRTDAYFEVPPQRAAAMAAVLRQAHHHLPQRLREMNEALYSAAGRAAAGGEPWRWS